MAKKVLKIYRVLNMIEATQIIEGNDLLDVRTNIALARMRAWGGSENQIFYDIIEKKKAQLKEDVKGKSPEETVRLNEEFEKERDETALNMDAAEWDFPELKLTQFEAQQDIVRAGGRIYKKGESLVPTIFFIKMGDLISE